MYNRGTPSRPDGVLKMKTSFDRLDVLLRALILVAGALSAVLLTLNGQGEALPALALGATLGAFMAQTSFTEE